MSVAANQDIIRNTNNFYVIWYLCIFTAKHKDIVFRIYNGIAILPTVLHCIALVYSYTLQTDASSKRIVTDTYYGMAFICLCRVP